jgi:hypothetical protein
MRGDSIIVFASPVEKDMSNFINTDAGREFALGPKELNFDAVLLRSSRDTRRITGDTVQSDVSLKRYFAPEGRTK